VTGSRLAQTHGAPAVALALDLALMESDYQIAKEDATPESLTVTEVVRHFADYVNRVVYRRESFVLVRGNKPVAELRPLPVGKRLGDLPGLFDSLPRLTVTEADAFAADLEDAREGLARTEVRDPWPS